MPPSEMTATSVVPPPISTTMLPEGSVTGSPAPIAAAIGSSISSTFRAPALSALSWMARRSTAVEPEGHADDDHRRGEAPPVLHLADEMLDHFLRDLEIGDDAVAQGADGVDVAGRAAEHLLGLVADRQHLLLAAHIGDGDDAGFIKHDAAAFDINKGVRGAEIDSHVRRHKAEQAREHSIGQPL